jgi:hypothetical protein
MALSTCCIWTNSHCVQGKKKGNIRIYVTMNGVRVTTMTVEKTVSVTYSELMPVVLLTQHVKRMHLNRLSTVVCPTLLHFYTLSHIWHNFREKSYRTQNLCFDFSANLSETFRILRRIRGGIIINAHRSSREALVTLVKYQSNLIFLDGSSKILRHQI